jgi:hypothetical protein
MVDRVVAATVAVGGGRESKEAEEAEEEESESEPESVEAEAEDRIVSWLPVPPGTTSTSTGRSGCPIGPL